MNNYQFTLMIAGIDPRDDKALTNFENRFFENGGDDATISSCGGTVIVEFDRQAECFEGALISAVMAVSRSGAEISGIARGFVEDIGTLWSRIKEFRQAAEGLCY
jgi:hypothetical protein